MIMDTTKVAVTTPFKRMNKSQFDFIHGGFLNKDRGSGVTKDIIWVSRFIHLIPENITNTDFGINRSDFIIQYAEVLKPSIPKTFNSFIRAGLKNKVKELTDALDRLKMSYLYEHLSLFDTQTPINRVELVSEFQAMSSANQNTESVQQVLAIRNAHLVRTRSISEEVVVQALSKAISANKASGKYFEVAEIVELNVGTRVKRRIYEKLTHYDQPLIDIYNIKPVDIITKIEEIKDVPSDSMRLAIIFVQEVKSLAEKNKSARFMNILSYRISRLEKHEGQDFEKQKVFYYNSAIMSMTSQGAFIWKKQLVSEKQLINIYAQDLQTNIKSSNDYMGKTETPIPIIDSYAIWHFHVPAGGCSIKCNKRPQMLNISEKYFSAESQLKGFTWQCFHHCIAYLLGDKSKDEDGNFNFTRIDNPIRTQIDSYIYEHLGICKTQKLDIIINGEQTTIVKEDKSPVTIDNAHHIIAYLRDQGLDPKNVLSDPHPFVFNGVYKKNDIILYDGHYFVWVPQQTKISKVKTEPISILEDEDITKMLENPTKVFKTLEHTFTNAKGEPTRQDYYLHVPYDYESRADKVGSKKGIQEPVIVGYCLPLSIASDIQPTTIYNEKGEEVEKMLYCYQACINPGASMFDDILKRTIQAYYISYVDEEGANKLKLRPDIVQGKIKIIFNAFNGSNYDTILLLREILSLGFNFSTTQACYHKGKMMMVRLKLELIPNLEIILWDVARFTVGSLDFNGRTFKVEAFKGVFDYDLIDYREKMTESDFNNLNKYLLHDVYVLKRVTEVLQNYFALLFELDIFDYVSLPQMTYTFWKHNYCPQELHKPALITEDKFIRKAAFGGIVYNYQPSYQSPRHTHNIPCPNLAVFDKAGQLGFEDFSTEPTCPSFTGGQCLNEECNDVMVPYDVNSLYPIACCRDFPYGSSYNLIWDSLSNEDKVRMSDKLGFEKPSESSLMSIISGWIVEVPEEFNNTVHIFPRKGKKGLSCRFKVGDKFHMTGLQMINMKRYGYKFKLHRIIYWEKKGKILEAFMRNFYKIRQLAKAAKNGILDQVAKLIMNSLTGKFLQQNMESDSSFVRNPKDLVNAAFSDKMKVLFQLDPVAGKVKEDEESWYFIQTLKEEIKVEKPSFLSAILLAHSKNIMLEYMEQFEVLDPLNTLDKPLGKFIGKNFKHFYYMDTDSFYINRIAAMSSGFKETTVLGGMKNDLGKIDAFITRGDFLGKKMYLVEKHRIANKKVEHKMATKGIAQPKKGITYEEDLEIIKQAFRNLVENNVALITNQLKFAKAFKGASCLSVTVSRGSKVITKKCTCIDLTDHHSGKCFRKNEDDEVGDCLPETHHTTRNCPHIAHKVKLANIYNNQQIYKKIQQDCTCELSKEHIRSCNSLADLINHPSTLEYAKTLNLTLDCTFKHNHYNNCKLIA